jgi:hypothetical protein
MDEFFRKSNANKRCPENLEPVRPIFRCGKGLLPTAPSALLPIDRLAANWAHDV